MLAKPHERVMLFIDGASTHKIAEGLGFQVDYLKLLKHIEHSTDIRLVRAYYYTMVKVEIDQQGQEIVLIQPLLDYLEYNGFSLITKDMREGPDSGASGERVRMRGSIMVELVCDMIRFAPNYDHAILFSGDGSYTYAIKTLQDFGKRVTVVSTMQTRPAAIADELKRQADIFVDLASLKTHIERIRK